MTGCALRLYEQLETSPETIEQELRPAVCERRQTDLRRKLYSLDIAGADSLSFQCGELVNKANRAGSK